jgi:hypothetical protein
MIFFIQFLETTSDHAFHSHQPIRQGVALVIMLSVQNKWISIVIFIPPSSVNDMTLLAHDSQTPPDCLQILQIPMP